jgi:hypothetical protein
MDYKIEIETSEEFKITYLTDDIEYFLLAKYEIKDYPESLRYGWYLYFGRNDVNQTIIYSLTNLNTPIKVLSELGRVIDIFDSKYTPNKISFITSDRLGNIFKNLYFSEYQYFKNEIDINQELDLIDKTTKFFTLFK